MDGEIVTRILAQYANCYPPLIDFKQAAEIAHVPVGTIRDFSSRKLFEGFRTKAGRRVLLDRDAFIHFILNRESDGN